MVMVMEGGTNTSLQIFIVFFEIFGIKQEMGLIWFEH